MMRLGVISPDDAADAAGAPQHGADVIHVFGTRPPTPPGVWTRLLTAHSIIRNEAAPTLVGGFRSPR
jgi:hypothetical protein